VNTFIHVNHDENEPRYGVLLCINGTGIQYSWIKNQLLHQSLSYGDMNVKAEAVLVGSDGVVVLPFGNGPERCLENKQVGGHILGLDFSRHNEGHIIRAAQEGIAFSFNYGLQIMTSMGMQVDKVRVGLTNMFLSPVFTEAFVNVTGMCVERYRTDGSQGAAIGAGIGAGLYKNRQEAFSGLEKVDTIEPDENLEVRYKAACQRWEEMLDKFLTT
jgi:xylulokinase